MNLTNPSKLILALSIRACLVALIGMSCAEFAAAQYITGQPADASFLIGQASFEGKNLGPINASSVVPTAIAIDPSSGKVFVLDADRNRVLRFASLSTLTVGGAAEGVLGQSDFVSANYGVSATRFRGVRAIAIDLQGNLFVAEGTRVLRFDRAAGLPNGAPATAVLGQANFTDREVAVSATRMALPTGLTVDAQGALYVADAAGRRVLRFDHASSKANGAAADGVIGQVDFTTVDVSRTPPNGFVYPYALAVDAAGRLFVSDKADHCVLRFDGAAAKANGAAADALLGNPGSACPDVPGEARRLTSSCMTSPQGIAVDGGGRLFVASSGDHRVMVFEQAATKSNGATADVVLGQTDAQASIPAAGTARLNFPMGVAVDASGRLYVADVSNHRIVSFLPQGTLATEPVPVEQGPVSSLRIGPNPATYAIGLELVSSRAFGLQIEVVNLAGQPVLSQRNDISAGTQRVSLGTGALAQGVYVLRLLDSATGQPIYTGRTLKQ
jgi:DNA-binding beta-propeller fold protein YncE